MRALTERVRPFFWKRWRDLIGPDDLLCSEASGFHPDQQEGAETFWSWLTEPREPAETLQRYCREEVPWHNADWERLLRNARLAFATGVAAGHLRHVGASDKAIDACLTWLGRASGFPEGHTLLPTQPVTGRVWAADLPHRLDQLLAALPETVEASFSHTYCKPALHLWLHYWLSGRQVARSLFSRQVATAMATIEEEIGHVHDLHFHLLPGTLPAGQPFDLIDHPVQAFRPSTLLWRQVLAQQLQALNWSAPVVWSMTTRPIENHPPYNPGNRPIGGDSHTLAIRVGLQALRDERQLDCGCLLAATLNGTTLKAVGGTDAKFHAAWRNAGITRIVVAPGGVSGIGPIDYASGGRPMPVIPYEELNSAYEEATGLATGLRLYLNWVIRRPDQKPPKYLGKDRDGNDRLLSNLYVQPDVLKQELRREEGPGERPVTAPVPGGTKTESEENLQRLSRAEPREVRVPWTKEWAKLHPRSRAVILGFPGDGKTLLAQMTVRELARQGLTELTQQRQPAAQVTLPVCLRLPDILEQRSLEAAAKASVPNEVPAAFVKHLCASLTGSNTWLFLDALDEVPETQRDELRSLLERDLSREEEAATVAANCRVVVTSRPWGYRAQALPFARITQYRLAPLNVRQQRAFINRWFEESKDPARKETVLALLQSNPSLGEVRRNPLLLTLTCAVGETHHLPSTGFHRAQLYELLIRDLVRGAWTSRPEPDNAALSFKIALLQDVAWRLFQEAPESLDHHDIRQWLPAVRDANNNLVRATAQELLAEWDRVGLIYPTKSGYTGFVHRSILEYLAAAHVATLKNPVAEIERFLWQPDKDGQLKWKRDATEMLCFLAGSLPKPDDLLRRLVKEHDARPDSFATMLWQAGRCLSDVGTAPLDHGLAERIASGLFACWKELGFLFKIPQGLSKISQGLAFPEALGRLVDCLHGDPEPHTRATAAKALGALGDRRAVEPLLYAFHNDQDKWVSGRAAEALGALGDGRAVEPLLHALQHGEDECVRMCAGRVLGALGDGRAVEPLLHALRQNLGWDVRMFAAWALGALGDGRAVEPLLHALQHDTVSRVREASTRVLGVLGDARAVEPLLHVLQYDEDESVRREAAGALGELGDARAVEPLLHALQHDEAVADAAVKALRALGNAQAVELLLHALQHDEDENVRSFAVQALGELGNARAVKPLLHAVQHDTLRVRWASAIALGELGDARAVEPLLKSLQHDEDGMVRMYAAGALGELGDARAVEPLLKSLQHDVDRMVRMDAAGALGALGDARAVEPLLHTSRHDEFVQFVARQALNRFYPPHRFFG